MARKASRILSAAASERRESCLPVLSLEYHVVHPHRQVAIIVSHRDPARGHCAISLRCKHALHWLPVVDDDILEYIHIERRLERLTPTVSTHSFAGLRDRSIVVDGHWHPVLLNQKDSADLHTVQTDGVQYRVL